MSEELKAAELRPCPFCGQQPHDDGDEVARRITCETEGCALYRISVKPEAWNRRSPEWRPIETLSSEALRARIRELVGELERIDAVLVKRGQFVVSYKAEAAHQELSSALGTWNRAISWEAEPEPLPLPPKTGEGA